ncbi:hypothetical protein GUJ93_ZPchr0008g12017 [Zizania palustris]|uniref:Uncharacterized protein n=1 Tax=Zizania palustris TaxID=103762 RepID=A0A8J5RKP8_ZIZPA|nr:hypothetical protein GUJ93_ZPchr0008g12017 [Zizania palustris]
MLGKVEVLEQASEPSLGLLQDDQPCTGRGGTGSSFTMVPTWMMPKQTTHSVQLVPLPLCRKSLSYMNNRSLEATINVFRCFSSSESTAAVAATLRWHHRRMRYLYSEKRQRVAAADAMTEQMKRGLSAF